MKYIKKIWESYRQEKIDEIEDLFLMYFVDEWGAKDTLKIPKQSSQDYQDYLKVHLAYSFLFMQNSNSLRITFFITPKLVDQAKLLKDINLFIERVRKVIGGDEFTCQAGFQESGNNPHKKVYSIRIWSPVFK